jgi:hypothetical protein
MKRNCAESGGGTRCDDHPDRSYVVVKEVEEDSFLEEDVCGASSVCVCVCVLNGNFSTSQLGFYLLKL